MEITDHNLLPKLESLSKNFSNLGIRLSLAAKELQNRGTPPLESLLEELMDYSKNFTDLKDQGLKLAQKSQVSTGVISSLTELEHLIKTVIETAELSINQPALDILHQILAIAHEEQPEFPPLELVKAQAQELYQTISQTKSEKLSDDAQALIENRHPLSGVLKLVKQGKNLDDEEWLEWEEKVNAAFDKKLTLAISRGKLTISNAPLGKKSRIILPTLEELERDENLGSQPTALQKPTTKNLSPLIVVPSGGGESNQTLIDDPDIMILEDSTSAKSLEELIIVPGVEMPQNSSKTQRPIGVSVGLKVIVHIQNLGDRSFAAREYAGTRGQSFRVEAFQVNIEPPIAGLNLEYMANIGGVGDTPWLEAGKLAGERGKARRLEGFAMRLTGDKASSYDVFYTAHVQNMGDLPVYSNGQYCGTRNKSLRVEGIKVWIEFKS
ncbi:Clostridial hydrophobic [Trichodesmium erythraeum IMS101]|uniref:Clostridial hydrophobic n=1 Tax=Trichodesmium erythraeum (strain IMS101) TaxID=203124 RepID=Q112A3_TRIEI|nr:hydrogenase [Trichodesmium erythraeum GBRTRLIN201]